MRFVVGVDLGKLSDYTAVSVIEAHGGNDATLPGYHVRHLVRYPLGTRYVDTVEEVCQLMERKPLWQQTQLVIDLTGVGVPVGEMFTEAGLRHFIGVVITGGASWHRESAREWHVAKAQLVGTVQKFLASGLLGIAQSLPHARTLKEELKNFRVKISKSAHEIYEAREGTHDDLTLSLAIALFIAEHPGPRFAPIGS